MRAGLLPAGLRWRAGACAVMFVVAVAGVGAGAFGAIYLRGSDQSVLNGALASALPANVGLTLQPAPSGPPHELEAAARRVPRPSGSGKWFGQPISTSDTGLTITSATEPYKTSLVSRTGVCGQVRIVDGQCPRAPNSVIVSTRSWRKNPPAN